MLFRSADTTSRRSITSVDTVGLDRLPYSGNSGRVWSELRCVDLVYPECLAACPGRGYLPARGHLGSQMPSKPRNPSGRFGCRMWLPRRPRIESAVQRASVLDSFGVRPQMYMQVSRFIFFSGSGASLHLLTSSRLLRARCFRFGGLIATRCASVTNTKTTRRPFSARESTTRIYHFPIQISKDKSVYF